MSSIAGGQIQEQMRVILSNEEYLDCFLLDVVFNTPKHVSVFIDSDSGVDFDLCRKMSRELESWLDDAGVLGDDYVLEVSSPGVDRPLKYLRQYKKHIGRKLKLLLKDGQKLEGRLEGITEDVLHLKKRVKKTLKYIDVPFQNIDYAIVQISFN